MTIYHVLYNPHAGNRHEKEAAYRLAALMPGDNLLFRDITEINNYNVFQFASQ